MKRILVTGGAGYIGSVCVKSLCDAGHTVIVIDNLSKGKKEFLDERALFYEGDLCDEDFVDSVFSKQKPEEVIHFAGYKAVGESMTDAPKYSDNIIGTIHLLNAMVRYKVHKIIFSSSAAVYGVPDVTCVDESCPTNPINYYGFTKLETENLLKWYSKIHGIVYVALRYFNVAGDVLGYVDPEAQNIMPILMEVATGKRDELVIFGHDYETKDGTCVRDYIHVQDLVDAHILALDCKTSEIINLGTGDGYSVKELVDFTSEIIGKELPFSYGDRRAGDPAALCASFGRAKKVLGWTPKRSIKEMLQSTYDAYLD